VLFEIGYNLDITIPTGDKPKFTGELNIPGLNVDKKVEILLSIDKSKAKIQGSIE
jgi:hypothetical protein